MLSLVSKIEHLQSIETKNIAEVSKFFEKFYSKNTAILYLISDVVS
jgi:hypothetical protein